MSATNLLIPPISTDLAHRDATLAARRFKLHLAQNVTDARHRVGWTQLELAQAADLSRATVHLIEAGLCDPKLSTITRLATALKEDVLNLLNRTSSV